MQDLRSGVRSILSRPGLSLAVILTLAIGIGLNTALFSVLHAVLLEHPSFKDPDRLVYVWETERRIGHDREIASPLNFLDWRDETRSFAGMAAWRTWFYTITGHGEPEQVWGVKTSAGFFQLLGVEAAIGRTFRPDEDQPGRDRVALISAGLWRRRFGGNPGIIGRPIFVDNQPLTVVGVLPGDFNLFGGTRSYDLWMPYPLSRENLSRADHSIIVFGRLRPGMSAEAAENDLGRTASRLAVEHPETNEGRGVRVINLHDDQMRDLGPALLIVQAAGVLLLLIACANAANLQLATVINRRRVLAIRTALGARRTWLLREVLIEFGLLAALAGMVALWAMQISLAPIRALLSSGGIGEVPRIASITLSPSVIVVSMLVTIVPGLVTGLGPALMATRAVGIESLRGMPSGSTSGRWGHRLHDALVVLQVALTVVLVVGASLLVRSLARISAIDPGFAADRLLTCQLWLRDSRYPTTERVARFYHDALTNVSRLPGVTRASAINFLPLSGWGDLTKFEIERTGDSREMDLAAQYRVIDADYFRTMGIAMLGGRAFTSADTGETPGVVIVNEAMARQFWSAGGPLAGRIRLLFPAGSTPWRPGTRDEWRTIVGVVRNVREFGLAEEPFPQVYLPYQQAPSRLMRLVVRTATEPMVLGASVYAAIRQIDRDQAVTEFKTMAAIVGESTFRRRVNVALIGSLGLLALLLASLSLHGLLMYSVNQRKRELGVRIALGATPRAVVGLILKEGVRLALIGAATGALAALAVASLLSRFLYGVGPADPATFGLAFLLVGITAALACYIPARNALRVDPATILRGE